MDERKLSEYIDTLNAGKMPEEHKRGFRGGEEQILFGTVRDVKKLGEIEYPDELFQKRLIKSLVGTEKRKRSRIKRYGALCTAAAAILLLVGVYYFLPDKSTDIVYAMESAMRELQAYHGVIEVSETNGLGETMIQSKREVWADKDGSYYIKEMEGSSKGTVTVNNGEQKWQVKPGEKTISRLPSVSDDYRFTFEIGSEINDVSRALTVEDAGIEDVHGRKTQKLTVTPDGGDPYFLWIDEETKLPLQKVSAMQNAIQIKAEYISFESLDEIPKELLTYEVPEGYGEAAADAITEETAASAEETEGASAGETAIPEKNFTEPQHKADVDMEAEENEQKSVDGGHSPWKLDPVFVSQVFASLLLSPDGIVGDYPIAYENIEIIRNNGTEAVAKIKDEKSIAKYIYLKRLIRRDETGIWTAVGYDGASQ